MNTLWGVPYFGWLAACLLIAVAYWVFVPKEVYSPNAYFLERIVVKYAHSLVWLLLGLACIIANYQRQEVAKLIALAALVTYLVFIGTLLKVKAKDKTEKASHHHPTSR